MVGELLGLEGSERSGGVARVASVEEVTRTPFSGPRWSVAVACGGLNGGRADWLVAGGTSTPPTLNILLLLHASV
jgi:hypothetical protein